MQVQVLSQPISNLGKNNSIFYTLTTLINYNTINHYNTNFAQKCDILFPNQINVVFSQNNDDKLEPLTRRNCSSKESLQ